MSNRNILVNNITMPSTCPMCRTQNSFDEHGENYVCRTCGHTIGKNELVNQVQDESLQLSLAALSDRI